MSYHNAPTSTPLTVSTTQSTTRSTTAPTTLLRTNALGQAAPVGYHYMADGVLMADSAMINQSAKVIRAFDLDLSPVTAVTSKREFSVVGDDGAVFSLEIKNELNYYYNFLTRAFQAIKAGLYDEVISNGAFNGSVIFPTVTDDDQYDIYLLAQPVTTKHADYNEVRFSDGSMDINSTTGSNSLLMTKVIYQYLDQTLTISPISLTGGIEIGGGSGSESDTITLSRGLTADKQAFSITSYIQTAAKCYRIIKQPIADDVIAFVALGAGAEPITIEGENIYPTATVAFAGDDINVSGGITSGSVVRMDNTDLSAVIKVGDKITTPVTTDTVNGDFSSGASAITMDSAVATKMAVGDRITSSSTSLANDGVFEKDEITVASLDSTNVFSMSSEAAIADNATLTFSSKINRSLTTVTVVETSGTATDFTMSQAIQFRDNAPLTFFNQMNYQWPVDNFAHVLKEGMITAGNGSDGGLITGTTIRKYQDIVTVFSNTKQEKKIVKKEVQPVNTLAIKPIITRGEISTQKGSIVFDRQQGISLGGTTLKLGGFGEDEILRVYGYEVIFSDLAIALTPITTTTTAAVNNSTSVPVASVNGILDDVSTVSGIGINPRLANPTVDTGAGAVSGSGTLVLTTAQTIENGATLTFSGAGQAATVTGSIQVLKAGNASQTLRIDFDKLVSIT